uniref:Secreted protein n=1 Tax=Lepeophtheirus salmonis TaxID=72036 RepID=A0A0K2V388_LEPSM
MNPLTQLLAFILQHLPVLLSGDPLFFVEKNRRHHRPVGSDESQCHDRDVMNRSFEAHHKRGIPLIVTTCLVRLPFRWQSAST